MWLIWGVQFFWQPPEPLQGPPCDQIPSHDVPAGSPANTTCRLETRPHLTSTSVHTPTGRVALPGLLLRWQTPPRGRSPRRSCCPGNQTSRPVWSSATLPVEWSPDPPSASSAGRKSVSANRSYSQSNPDRRGGGRPPLPVPTCSSMKMSPAKCGLKSWISVPMFSFTTATRGTPSSSSWGFREDSSEASCGTADGHRRTLHREMCSGGSVTSLHRNHPGRRTAMTTAPLVCQRLFALMTLSTNRTGSSRF